jgi:hypothetical protein
MLKRAFGGGGMGFWSLWMRCATIWYTRIEGFVTAGAWRLSNVTSGIGAP